MCVPPNKQENNGRTLLMFAALKGKTKICRVLLTRGARVDARDSDGKTPLHWAAERGSPSTVQLLLDRGAPIAAEDNKGRKPLHCALQFSNLDAAALLLPRDHFALQADHTGRTELHWAAAHGSEEMVKWLLRDPDSLLVCDAWGMTPLVCALEKRNLAAAMAILNAPNLRNVADEWGALPDAAGMTPLHWAAGRGFDEVVRHLLESFQSPWKKDRHGRDALMLAVECRHRDTVRTILAHAGFRQRNDNSGRTALHLAVEIDDPVIIDCLVGSGASTLAVDAHMRTPLAVALAKGRVESARVLLAVGDYEQQQGTRDYKQRSLLHQAALGGSVELVHTLLELGAPINARDVQKRTPISYAITSGHKAAATKLATSRGFELLPDSTGTTALHMVAKAGWWDLVFLLVSLGGDPMQEDNFGKTAAMRAIEGRQYSLAKQLNKLSGVEAPSVYIPPNGDNQRTGNFSGHHRTI